jgi:hypothetical protein
MLNGATFSAAAIVGTAVFKMVVSSDSMKNATATSHGSNALLVLPGVMGDENFALELIALMNCELAAISRKPRIESFCG